MTSANISQPPSLTFVQYSRNDGTSAQDQIRTAAAAAPNANSCTLRPAATLGQISQQKRVTKACYECHRRKTKCNGSHPCSQCEEFFYDCRYVQPPPKRKRTGKKPQPNEVLESRLRHMENLVQTLARDSMTSPIAFNKTQDLEKSKQSRDVHHSSHSPLKDKLAEEHLLETMVMQTGQLTLDDQVRWSYQGQSSGEAFFQRMQEELGDWVGASRQKPRTGDIPVPRLFNICLSPLSANPRSHLPSKEIGLELVNAALDDACAIDILVHRPKFDFYFNRIYQLDCIEYTAEDMRNLALLYSVLALGCLFWERELEVSGHQQATAKGNEYFTVCQQMIDITDCRDLTTLQAIVFMNIFLKSSSKTITCYTNVGVALSLAVRMGLHRSIEFEYDLVERETRKRVFWVIRNMNTYVAVKVGLPLPISSDDIDQELPLEVDDEYITKATILDMPAGHISIIAASNAYTNLLKILEKVMKYIYPTTSTRKFNGSNSKGYFVSPTKVLEIEDDLKMWKNKIPPELWEDNRSTRKFQRAQYNLRFAYSNLQLMLYRPFLHYLSAVPSGGKDSKYHPSIYAFACINTGRELVRMGSEMEEKKLLNGAYWSHITAIYFAALSLIFPIIIFANTDIIPYLEDVKSVKRVFESLAPKNMIAERGARTLSTILQHLFGKLKHDIRRAIDPAERGTSEYMASNNMYHHSSGVTPTPLAPVVGFHENLGNMEQSSETAVNDERSPGAALSDKKKDNLDCQNLDSLNQARTNSVDSSDGWSFALNAVVGDRIARDQAGNNVAHDDLTANLFDFASYFQGPSNDPLGTLSSTGNLEM